MKKITQLILIMSFVAGFVTAQTGIKFETGTWAQIQEKAKKENKFIFVDAYTTWCGPCKWMSKNIFPNDTAGNFYNQYFISAKIDMEKGEGKDFATKYEVKFYPSYLFFNPKGDLVHRSGGSKKLHEFITDGENALDSNKQVVSLKKKYESGLVTADVVENYAYALSDLYEKNNGLATDYIKLIGDEKLYTQKSFSVILNLSNLDEEGAGFVLKNSDLYKKNVGENVFRTSIEGELFESAWEAGEKNDEKKLAVLIDITNKYLTNAKELVFKINSIYYQASKKHADFYKNFILFTTDFPNQSAEEYNGAAWFVFEHFTENDKLEQALVWANKSVEIEKNSMNLDTKANIEFKLGKTKDAKLSANEAIVLAKNNKLDASDTEKLLKKIEQKLK